LKGWIRGRNRQAKMAAKAMRIECADDVFAIRVPPELSGYELVNGQLVAVSPVGADHGSIAVRVTRALRIM
jgi:Uma2 family endonuclease